MTGKKLTTWEPVTANVPLHGVMVTVEFEVGPDGQERNHVIKSEPPKGSPPLDLSDWESILPIGWVSSPGQPAFEAFAEPATIEGITWGDPDGPLPTAKEILAADFGTIAAASPSPSAQSPAAP